MAVRHLSLSLFVGLLAAIALLYWDDLELLRESITSVNRVRVQGQDAENEAKRVRGQNDTNNESPVELDKPTSNQTDGVDVTIEGVDDVETTGDGHAESSRTQGSANESSRDSPVCRPHFRAATNSSNPWSDQVKFKRIYFYHFRKAGGTNLRIYLGKVAAHHGLEYGVTEYGVAETPGEHPLPTLYVTIMREPVARSISHFKYEGRWDCRELVYNSTFHPTEENARKIEDWNETYGFEKSSCRYKKEGYKFHMTTCAVNCYSQWAAGLSCPWWEPPEHPGPGPEGYPKRKETPIAKQYDVAKAKLLSYNLIVITEWLKYPDYITSLERFFATPNFKSKHNSPWCEIQSHNANSKNPLNMSDATREKLTNLNAVDIHLYNELRSCSFPDYSIPAFDPTRFESNDTLRVDLGVYQKKLAISGKDGRRLKHRSWIRS